MKCFVKRQTALTSAVIHIYIVAQALNIVIGRNSDECCKGVRVEAGCGIRHITRVLKSMVCHLEEHPLLRVHTPCFTRRYAEEHVIKSARVLDKVSKLRFQDAFRILGRIVVL